MNMQAGQPTGAQASLQERMDRLLHDPELCQRLIDRLARALEGIEGQRMRFMEVCGTHTVSIFQSGLRSLPREERVELARWLFTLPLYAKTEVGGRKYLLVHAGIDPTRVEADGIEVWDEQALDDVVGNQYRDDLMWIRDDFWGAPTGLVNDRGEGPIVIAGHTPTKYLDYMADYPDRISTDSKGLCRMVRVGACERTGGVADRWDIDCGCAGGAGFGQLLMLRLDDGEEIYEPVREGE